MNFVVNSFGLFRNVISWLVFFVRHNLVIGDRDIVTILCPTSRFRVVILLIVTYCHNIGNGSDLLSGGRIIQSLSHILLVQETFICVSGYARLLHKRHFINSFGYLFVGWDWSIKIVILLRYNTLFLSTSIVGGIISILWFKETCNWSVNFLKRFIVLPASSCSRRPIFSLFFHWNIILIIALDHVNLLNIQQGVGALSCKLLYWGDIFGPSYTDCL